MVKGILFANFFSLQNFPCTIYGDQCDLRYIIMLVFLAFKGLPTTFKTLMNMYLTPVCFVSQMFAYM